MQQPGRIVFRLTQESNVNTVSLAVRGGTAGSAADTITAPGELTGLTPGKYYIEIANPEVLFFQTNLALTPAETETLFIPAQLNTRKLVVDSEPSGAEIWINGLQTSVTPDTFDIRTGDSLILELKLKDYQTYLDTLVMDMNIDLDTLVLRKLYSLWIAPRYDYTVYLIYDEDNRLVYSGSGSRRLELPQGNYRLAWEIGEGQYRTKAISMNYNQTATIP